MNYVTESEIPFNKAFYMTDRFVILNMDNQGIWYVDKEHSDWKEIKQTALNVAKSYNDKELYDKIMNCDKP
jgi:hypothetical protein